MAPSAIDSTGRMANGLNGHKINTLTPHDEVQFDPSLKPKSYQIKGTKPDSKILFLDVNILDSTGKDPYRGNVYIEGERIRYVGDVPDVDKLSKDPKVRTIQGHGRTLMSGLGDAHVHFSWNNGDLGRLGDLGVEEHTLLTARSAQTYIDSGYTMCFGAASAKERLDCVVRDAINNGDIPGPRYLANGKEMAVPDGELVPGITAFAKGPLEMREVIRHHINIGVDQIKLSMSGEQITETRDAQDCYFSDEETAACVDEAHRQGVRLCAHARARDSVKMCIRHGVDIIYHASWIDEEGMDMLEKNKHKHIVAPGINWLIATLYDSAAFGYSFEKAEQVGYKKELEVAIKGLKEMHRRGITVLPGGDYGFGWTPHGTYARDLEHFVKILDFTPMESIISATAGVAKLFMREDELGKILPGYFADCILVDGNPLDDISILQDHDKLNVILINGRVHKASYKEFTKIEAPTPIMEPRIEKMQNFVAYKAKNGIEHIRMGHLDRDKNNITPLSFKSGTAVENLYQIIEVGAENVVAGGEPLPISDITILPPISGRDVLAVGKNYSEHAKEFNASGYDASDKVDMPSHPVIFTKRATSIIAHEEEILLHEDFTQTLDYEGEIGVIVGKGGYKIDEKDAEQHVWGYTIINDITAREKQRDHKQFFIGKSADTFCPMGPTAVPKSALPSVLTVTTEVNGQQRQKGTTDDLIFSIPNLLATLSASQTLRPGDVIATGTPAGVGFGLTPPVFLQPGDVVSVSVTGLGTLSNTVSAAGAANYIAERLKTTTTLPTHNLSPTRGGIGLTTLPNGKQLHVRKLGTGPEVLLFVHGLGGSMSFFDPLVTHLNLAESKTYTSLLFDLEGHGYSPTRADAVVDIASIAADILALLDHPDLDLPRGSSGGGVTLIAHSLACLPALHLASSPPPHSHPKISTLILLSPPPIPLPSAAANAMLSRAATVRSQGMSAVASTVAAAGTGSKASPLALAAVKMSLLSTDPEGYAKGCMALAGGKDLEVDWKALEGCRVTVVAGEEDKVSKPEWVRELVGVGVGGLVRGARVAWLEGVGHWCGFEDGEGTAGAVGAALGAK